MLVSFFWGEEVIQQTDNKVMVIALNGDRKLLIPKSYVDDILEKHKNQPAELMFAIERLGLLINISELTGEFEPVAQFYTPSGKPHGQPIAFGKIIIPENKSYNLIFKANPFPFPELGKYTFELEINGEKFNSDITILSE